MIHCICRGNKKFIRLFLYTLYSPLLFKKNLMAKLDPSEWFIDRQVRNTANQDRLLDWLPLYGNGIRIPVANSAISEYIVKKDSLEPDYKSSIDFASYVGEQKRLFFSECIKYLARHLPSEFKASNGEVYPTQLVEITKHDNEMYQVSKHENTINAMNLGIPIIIRGVLHDHKSEMISTPDMLIKKKLLPSFFTNFKEFIIAKYEDSTIGLGSEDNSPCEAEEYAIVHVRFAKLSISKFRHPELLASSNGRYYEALLNAQARALSNIMGYKVDRAYVLGRGWKCGSLRNCNAFDMMAIVSCNKDSRGYSTLIKATNWLKKLNLEGKEWQIVPRPSNNNLYPNMKNSMDMPWTNAKKHLANYLGEITLLWNVGPIYRNLCLKRGVYSYDDPDMSTNVMSMPEGKRAATLRNIIADNKRRPSFISDVSIIALGTFSKDVSLSTLRFGGLKIESKKLLLGESKVRLNTRFTSSLGHMLARSVNVEFFVDFETSLSISDNFAHFPHALDSMAILWIGCGYEHPIKKNWVSKIFYAKNRSKVEEAKIIDEWLTYMINIKYEFRPRKRKHGDDPTTEKIKIFHWSHAEKSFLESNYNSAVARHGRDDWKGRIEWCDVFALCRTEKFTIPGCLNFSLKSVTKALYKLGYIDHIWPESPIDGGLKASMALLRCYEQNERYKIPVEECIWARELSNYLSVDTYAVYSIVKLLRHS